MSNKDINVVTLKDFDATQFDVSNTSGHNKIKIRATGSYNAANGIKLTDSTFSANTDDITITVLNNKLVALPQPMLKATDLARLKSEDNANGIANKGLARQGFTVFKFNSDTISLPTDFRSSDPQLPSRTTNKRAPEGNGFQLADRGTITQVLFADGSIWVRNGDYGLVPDTNKPANSNFRPYPEESDENLFSTNDGTLWEKWTKVSKLPSNLEERLNRASSPVEYTASNGVKKIGNDFQVDLLNKSTNDLKLVNGKLYTPKGLDLIVTQCYPIITTTSTIKKSNGYQGKIAVAVVPTYQPYNYFGVDNQGSGQVRVQPKLDDVKVSLTFKDGSERYVTRVRLAKNGLAKDDNVVIEDKFNMDLNNTNINYQVSNLTYTGNTISFDVSQIRAFNQLPVMLIFDLDLSSANIDQQTNIIAGSSISTTDESQLFSLQAQVAGELSFSFTKRA